MNHFLADEWKRASAKKRRGGQSLISLDLAAGEERFDLEPSDDAVPRCRPFQAGLQHRYSRLFARHGKGSKLNRFLPEERTAARGNLRYFAP